MTPKPIPFDYAMAELVRINDYLSEPLLLIGGLAVHQYEPTRESQDIDLVCSYDVQNSIVKKLYPSDVWRRDERHQDSYRPEWVIARRVDRSKYPAVRFGPKILERGPYAPMEWEDFLEDARPAQYKTRELKNILIPRVERLCLMKAISFLSRNRSLGSKIKQDLQDFADLSNHPEFNSNAFYDLLRQWKAEAALSEGFVSARGELKEILDTSSLRAIANLFIAPDSGSKVPPDESRSHSIPTEFPILQPSDEQCASGINENDWLKGNIVQKSPVKTDTSDLFLVWLDISPGWRAEEAREFLLKKAASVLNMTVETVYDVFGKHDMLLKLRGQVADNQISALLEEEMGKQGFLGPKRGKHYHRSPVVLNVVKEHVGFRARDERIIRRGITAFLHLSEMLGVDLDEVVDMVGRSVGNKDAARLVGLFEAERDVVAEVYLSCGGYYDLAKLVFQIESELNNNTNYDVKRTTLLVMQKSIPPHTTA